MPQSPFSDPIFSSQWYLINTGQRGGQSRLDLNVLPAWQMGFDGSGVRVAINDDGMDLTHPDLVANIDGASVFDTNRSTIGKGFSDASSKHGTVVGSIVGMAANGIGGVGIAYKSVLIPGLAVGASVDNAFANLFAANLAARADISVNSWGSDPAFAENFGATGSAEDQAWGAQLLRNATAGRNGLGMFIEVSAGNERGNRADASLSNFTGNKVVASVAAVDQFGVVTDYSTPGASNLVSAFGGVGSADQSMDVGFGIPSADIQSTAGYNKTSGTSGDYAYQNQGTSYSGPMVGAAAALMLQANPALGFRDISNILAATARQTDASNPTWVTTASSYWNLSGAHFSRDYGYGLIDIAAAVRLSQSWMGAAATVANWAKAEGSPSQVGLPIPDDSNSALTVTSRVAENVIIDRMEFDLNLTATAPSQLKAQITSPSGTTITLFDQPLTRPLKDGEPDTAVVETPWPSTFTIGAAAFMGETSAGNWTLTLKDMVKGTVASFNALTVRAWGSAVGVDDQYVFTEEFKGSKTLTDIAGTDTLNAAACTKQATLNLGPSATSTIAGGTVTLATDTLIENAIGGAGDDVITGNAANNLLRGNGGNDTLDGGAGIDTAIYSGTRSGYTVSATGSKCVVSALDLVNGEGRDNVLNVERLRFSDSSLALDTSGNAGEAAKIIGAALGKGGFANLPIVGVVLGFMDSGGNADVGAALLVQSGIMASLAGGADNQTLERFVLSNLGLITSPRLDSILSDQGQVAFFKAAVVGSENILNIDLVGLAKTGLAYV